MNAKQVFWFRWMREYSLGEILAVGSAITIARLLFINFSGLSDVSYNTLTIGILVLAGAVEGLLIGYFQWRYFSRIVSGFKSGWWIAVAGITSIVGWLAVLPPSVILIAVLAKTSLINNFQTIFYTGLIGAAFGTLVSFPQFLLLRRYELRNRLNWVLANIAGWTAAFLTVNFAISLISDNSSVVYNFLLIAASCILSGSFLALFTGLALPTMISQGKQS